MEKLLSYTDNKKADVIIECSGNPDVIPGLPDFLRDGGWGQSDEGGRIHLQGDYPRPASFIPYQRWFVKNATVSMTCALRPGIKEKVLALISQKKFDARSLYNKVYNINDAPQAYKYLEKNRYDTLKILLEW
ncbi:MAG TPA: hypothetical protein DC049_04660 [Spirochaetia bacterium]|nr:hypothetical protein [Spirochaetia bacterium]